MKIWVFICEIFKSFPVLFIITTALVALASVLEMCSLVTVGPLIDFLINADSQNLSPLTTRVMAVMDFVGLSATIGTCITIFGIFVILTSCFRILTKYSIMKTRYLVTRKLMLGTFEDFFSARWYFFSSSEQGTLFSTLTTALKSVGWAFDNMAFLFADSLQLAFFLVTPFFISWQVTSVSLVMALLFVWPFLLAGKLNYKFGREALSASNKIMGIVQESFSLAKIILGFGNQKKICDNLRVAFDARCRVAIKSETLSAATPTLYQPFGVMVVIAAVLAARRFGVHLSEITVLLLALLRAIFLIGKLAAEKNGLDNHIPYYEQIKHLRQRATELKPASGVRQFKGFARELCIEGLSFAYPAHKPVLVDINMRIPKGKMVAIVGESGAGKTTLIDIIIGFHQPTAGRIMFDDVVLEDFDIYSYRHRIGYVPQDSALFNMTIKDNLLWACESATDEEIADTCRQANADEFIRQFPEGYNTLVGDRGVRLSGGQVQRIALARAILRKPDLLILDEATSSLDTYSERLIQRAIENIAKKTTVVVIAHRLSTIVNADYIYVLKNGRIIEEGTYLNLVGMDGHFNRMVKLQMLEGKDSKHSSIYAPEMVAAK